MLPGCFIKQNKKYFQNLTFRGLPNPALCIPKSLVRFFLRIKPGALVRVFEVI